MEPTQKKGLSKGCLVALIIAGVLLVIIIIAGVTCWYYKDDLARMATGTAIDGIKTTVAENPPEGVDTVQFNALTDAFMVKLNEGQLDYEKYGVFMQAIQGVVGDEEITAEEADRLCDAMIDYFPDLADMVPSEEPPDTVQVEDSTGLQ